MKDLYLSQLELQGFRTYKDKTTLTFPEGPGLTVIVGPNGLGKSTIFDGLEWGLTGGIQRIDSIKATSNEKDESIGINPKVKLQFTDDTAIFRTKSTVRVGDDFGQDNLDKWLVNPDWTGTNNIADCLHFTHFLGQSTRQLFVHQDGNERFSRLEGPTGLKKMWSIEQALGRQKTTNAFSKSEEEAIQKQSDLEEENTRVIKLINKLNITRQNSRSKAAMNPDEISEAIDANNAFILNSFGYQISNFETLDEALNQEQKAIEAVDSGISKEQVGLEEWIELAKKYESSLKERDEIKLQLSGALREAQELNELLLLKKSENSISKNICETKKGDIKDKLSTFEELLSLIKDHNDFINLEKQSENLNEELNSFTQNLQVLELKLVQQIEVLNSTKKLKRELALGHENQKRLKANLDNYNELLKANTSLFQITNEFSKEELLEPNLIAERERCTNLIEIKSDKITSIMQQKTLAQNSASAIANAVSQISSHLTEDDCFCPVCDTPFDAKGSLKEAVESSTNKLDKHLSEITISLNFVLDEKSVIQKTISELDLKLSKIKQTNNEIVLAKERVISLEKTLRTEPYLVSISSDMFKTAIESESIKNQETIDKLTEQFKEQVSESEVSELIESLTNEKVNKNTKLSLINANLESNERQTKLIANKISELSESPLPELIQRKDALNDNLDSLRKTIDESNEQYEKTKNSLKVHSQLCEKAKGKVSVIDAQLGRINTSLITYSSNWNTLGYKENPTVDIVSSYLTKMPNKFSKLEELKVSHKKLLDGRDAYSELANLQELESNINGLKEKYKVENESELLANLHKLKDDATNKIENIRSVARKRETIIANLRDRNTKIRDNINVPLNSSVAKFCSSLMSDRDLNVSVDNIATKASAQSLLSFQLDDKEQNPLLYMSEGQLAATSLCLLFGASVTYPWSRWKGLLLDDPLHHNDTIHSSSFIDVIRNLILNKGYQIVVSTHDMELAGYFIRKCINADIPARYWHLQGRNENGVNISRGHS